MFRSVSQGQQGKQNGSITLCQRRGYYGMRQGVFQFFGGIFCEAEGDL